MEFVSYEERSSDSPFVESVMHGFVNGEGSGSHPAENHWHMVFVKLNGAVIPIITGPVTKPGILSWQGAAEVLWIKFNIGAFLAHIPSNILRDTETTLPKTAANSFWLGSAAWQFPTYDNVETFVNRLVHENTLMFDSVVGAALQQQPLDVAPRTMRYRFLRATGLTRNQNLQIDRARQAETLLLQGKSILDTVFELGYYDQPHLTRSLKHWIGNTPAQILHPIQLA